jgi:hypothetical protein
LYVITRAALLAAGVLAAVFATPAIAVERLSLGSYFVGLQPPPVGVVAPLGDGVVSFTPRLGGFRVGEVEIGLGGSSNRSGDRFAIGQPSSDWSAGASLGLMGFTIAGGVQRGEADRLGASLQYDLGSWSLMLGGGHATATEPQGGEERQLQLELGASYAFGPGVLGAVGVQTYAPDDQPAAPSGEGDSVYFTGGFKVRF